MILQVHDELVLETSVAVLDEVRTRAIQYMTSVVSLKVPLEVDAGAGATWDEAH